MIRAAPRAGKSAFGEVHAYQFLYAQLQQRAGGVPQCHGVQCAVAAADGEAGGFAGLEFIEDAVIHKR